MFSGYLYTWGDSYNFHLGHMTRQPLYVPTKVDLVYKESVIDGSNVRMFADLLRRDKPMKFKFESIGTGPFHTACITENGQVYSFGEDWYMKLGHEATTKLPHRVLGLSGHNIKTVACGLDFNLALTSSGKVFSWGYGGESNSILYSLFFHETPGALGQGDHKNYYIPTLIQDFDDILQIEAGFYHSLALAST